MNTISNSREQAAFTLVEMAIVIVIIGLLVGGVLMGKNLIRNADLQTIITDASKYKSAAKQFSDKYLALPGDFSEATGQWGKDNTNCAGHTGTAATPGTCNGNGNGFLNAAAAASQTGEQFQFWKQLQLEGLIDGVYSGLAGSGGTAHSVPGTNCPKGKIDNTGWSAYFWTTGVWGNAAWFDAQHGNMLVFGEYTTTSITTGTILTPKEAWNIDSKIDDGKPGTGDVMTPWNASCTTATAQTDNLTATYNLSYTSEACRMEFPRAF